MLGKDTIAHCLHMGRGELVNRTQFLETNRLKVDSIYIYMHIGHVCIAGAISAVCEKLFEQVVLAKDTLCQISVSLMEIYNDEVN